MKISIVFIVIGSSDRIAHVENEKEDIFVGLSAIRFSVWIGSMTAKCAFSIIAMKKPHCHKLGFIFLLKWYCLHYILLLEKKSSIFSSKRWRVIFHIPNCEKYNSKLEKKILFFETSFPSHSKVCSETKKIGLRNEMEQNSFSNLLNLMSHWTRSSKSSKDWKWASNVDYPCAPKMDGMITRQQHPI